MDAILGKLLENADPLVLLAVAMLYFFTKDLKTALREQTASILRLAEAVATRNAETPQSFRRAPVAPEDPGYGGTE